MGVRRTCQTMLLCPIINFVPTVWSLLTPSSEKHGCVQRLIHHAGVVLATPTSWLIGLTTATVPTGMATACRYLSA